MKAWISLLFLLLVSSPSAAQVVSRSQMSEASSADEQEENDFFHIELLYAQGSFTLDVINEFANQLRTESKDLAKESVRTQFRLTESLFVFANFEQSKVSYENTPQHELEKSELDYYDWNAGFGYSWKEIGLRLGYGRYDYHSFLETDTALYFHDEINSNYVMLGIDYHFETTFFFDVEMFYDYRVYLESEVGQYSIDQGEARIWGGRLIFDIGRFKVGAGYQRSHFNVKMIHDFFGLENEMNNKVQSNQFFVFSSYSF